MITKTDAYFKKLDSKLRTSLSYSVSNPVNRNLSKKQDITVFTDRTLSRYELNKLVDILNSESEKYFIVKKEVDNLNSLNSSKGSIYLLNKKLNSNLIKSTELLLSFTENQLPKNYSPKRFDKSLYV